MKILIFSALIIVFSINAEAQNVKGTMQESLDQTIEAVFKAICFLPGDPPNMRQIRPFFADQGIMINYNDEQPLILPVDQFISHFEAQVSAGILPSLEDREVHSETKIYGRIAHRFSFYEARLTKDDAVPFAVGVNSIQLIRVGNDWKITSMAWNDDNDGDGFFKRVLGH